MLLLLTKRMYPPYPHEVPQLTLSVQQLSVAPTRRAARLKLVPQLQKMPESYLAKFCPSTATETGLVIRADSRVLQYPLVIAYDPEILKQPDAILQDPQYPVQGQALYDWIPKNKRRITSVLNEVERVDHASGSASTVAVCCRAVDDLLHGVFCLGLVEDRGDSLNCTNCRECIGGNTKSLVLHRAHCSIRDPIDTQFHLLGDGLNHRAGRVWLDLGEEGAFKLFLGVGCELVDAHLVGLIGLGVVIVDDLQVPLKDLESVELVLLREIEHESMLMPPLIEELLSSASFLRTEHHERCSGSERKYDGKSCLLHKILAMIYRCSLDDHDLS